MSKQTFPIATAKKSSELAGTWTKVKDEAKKFSFSTFTDLKTEVVGKAMDAKKKQADFVIELELGKGFMKLDLVCVVKDEMKSVVGRSMLSKPEEYFKAEKLAKALNKDLVYKECGWK